MIEVDLAKCTGCRRCEAACAFFHTGRISNHLSRIKVLNLFESGVDGPVVCVQCRERYCLKCPEKALTVGEEGQVYVSPTRCNLCGACEKNCPVGAMEIFNELLYVCDLCGGDPKCIRACTEGAIVWIREKQEAVSLEEYKEAAKGMNPSQKRRQYLKDRGDELRETWRRKGA